MIARIASLGLALLAVLVLVDSASAKDKKGQHGAVKSVSASELVVTVTTKEDKTGTDQTLKVADNVSVVVDGNPGKIDDIKAGDKIRFTTDADGKVVTITKGKKPKA